MVAPDVPTLKLDKNSQLEKALLEIRDGDCSLTEVYKRRQAERALTKKTNIVSNDAIRDEIKNRARGQFDTVGLWLPTNAKHLHDPVRADCIICNRTTDTMNLAELEHIYTTEEGPQEDICHLHMNKASRFKPGTDTAEKERLYQVSYTRNIVAYLIEIVKFREKLQPGKWLGRPGHELEKIRLKFKDLPFRVYY